MRLQIIDSNDSITHVALIGRLDVQGVNAIQYEFHHQTTSQPKSVIVDLSRMPYIASLGIGMLISAAKYLERNGARMVLVGSPPLVKEAFETAGLHQVIPMVSEETAALALLR
jgi:anti-sigma B factor antagonist